MLVLRSIIVIVIIVIIPVVLYCSSNIVVWIQTGSFASCR